MTPAPMHMPLNPHFDHKRVIWNDAWSGSYAPVPYDQQFDAQWRYFLEHRAGFRDHTGVETAIPYVDDRIAELTGVEHLLTRRHYGPLAPLVIWWRRVSGDDARRGIGGRLVLEPKLDAAWFDGKYCLDLGCGAGRWTRALMALGARVTSVDTSLHALASTRRFNDDVQALDLFDIERERPDLHRAFDFTVCWGVVMCTHDPCRAFANLAMTVRPGGQLYVMIYAPTYHASEAVLESRWQFYRECTTDEERLAFARNMAEDPRNTINYLDMLSPFYNWTVEEETVHGWFRDAGFVDVKTLNAGEPHKAAHHVLGTAGSSSKTSW